MTTMGCVMKKTLFILFVLTYYTAVLPVSVSADPYKDESGHGRGYKGQRYYGGEQKEEYWEGGCKVERKWERSGEYKEERKCPGGRDNYWGDVPPVHHYPGIVVPPPSVIIQPPPIVIQPHR